MSAHADMTSSILYDNIDADQLQRDADECLLFNGVPLNSEIIVHAEGRTIVGHSGHRLLDWTSGQMSCLLGHGHPEVVEVVAQHARHLDHLFSGMVSPPTIQLAKRLTSLTPPGLDKVFFPNTGGESVEGAIRLAKFYTGKFEIVGLNLSWHGMTGGAVAAQYQSGRAGYGPTMPGNFALPAPNAYRSIFRHPDGSHDWRTELDYGFGQIDRQSCGSLAAVILEPILSSGGMLVLPPGYLKAVKEHCERRGMLLIIDEAQTGIGRSGDWFAFQHFPEDEGVVPDVLCLSKTMGNGLPLSAVVTSNKIAQFAKENHFLFLTTHMNDPLPTAVGVKVLEIMLRDKLVERSRELGKKLQAGLLKLKSRYGCIGDVRGRGLLAGIEIVAERTTKTRDDKLAAALGLKLFELGLWAQLAMLAAFGGIFRMAPPLTTTDEELQKGLDIFEKAFAATPGTQPLYLKN